MKRKNFLKQAGVAGASFLLHQQMLAAFATVADNTLKIGVVGCGDRGNGIIRVMKESKAKFEVIAICDVLKFRVDAAQKLVPAAKVYTDFRQLLEDKSIEAIVIATPLSLHYPIAVAALEAGKHIYLEKAMTYSIEEAILLVKLAKQYPKQIIQVGHQYRYTPLYFKVKDMIAKGYLGKITQIETRWDRNWNWRRPVPAGYTDEQVNWRMYKKYSGGLVAELLSHQMDFINWAFDTHPDVVYGTGGIDYYKDGRETYDNVQVTMRYSKEGMIGNFGATCANEREGYIFKLKGTKGTVSLLMHDGIFYPEKETRKQLETVDGVTGATKLEWNKDGGVQIMNEPMKDGTWYALEEFYKVVAEKSTPVSNVITGGTTAICVHMANQAIYNNTIQNWKNEYNLAAY
jgi:predicted dehydrogenase